MLSQVEPVELQSAEPVSLQRWPKESVPPFWYVGIPIVAVCQRKGGPGKTTLLRMLAEYLALNLKLRVLLIDYDTQCSLSFLYVRMEMDNKSGSIRPPVHPQFEQEGLRYSSADLFASATPVPYATTRLQGDFVIDILPGDKDRLTEAERWQEQEEEARAWQEWEEKVAQSVSSATELEKLRKARREQLKKERKEKIEQRTFDFFRSCEGEINQMYDVVLIDTAPANSPLTLSAMRAATHMLVPLEYEEQCFKGMRDMISMWNAENSVRPPERRLELLGIQPNKVKLRRKLQAKIHRRMAASETLKGFLSDVLIPDRGEYAERDAEDAAPCSIFQLGASNEARIIAEQFGAWVSQRLFGSLIEIPQAPQLAKRKPQKAKEAAVG